jgi:hypothetical protein
MKLDEIKERLNRKYALAYAAARSFISETSADELKTELAKMEGWLPRLGETVVTTPAYLDDEEDWSGRWACLAKNPPEEEIKRDREGYLRTWKDDQGRVWKYHWDLESWVFWIPLMVWVNALRDELAHRRDREFTHDHHGYDS